MLLETRRDGRIGFEFLVTLFRVIENEVAQMQQRFAVTFDNGINRS